MWTGLVWLRIGTGRRALLNSVINLRVPYNAGELASALITGAPRVVLSSIELVIYNTE
jgi:hypothetical protein